MALSGPTCIRVSTRSFIRVAVVLSLGLMLLAPAAYAGSFAIFGPRQFVRGTGAPVTETATFTASHSGTYTLRIENSHVSSAVVTLNGATIFEPNDFKNNVAQLSKPVTLIASNTLTVEVRGGPGDSFTASITGTDDDLPLITATATPSPNANGWNAGDVTVSFTCSDATSGIATCAEERVLTNEGAGQVVTGEAADNAGNIAQTSITLNIDRTAPIIAVVSPASNTVVAALSAVVTGAVSETGSGVTAVTCGETTVPVVNGAFVCTVSLVPGSNTFTFATADLAGNESATSLVLRLAAAPSISITEPDNLTFVNISPITVRGTVDAGATVKVGGISAPVSGGTFSVQVPLVEGNNTITAVAESAAGFAGTSNVQVTLDTTPPRVNINSPADGFTTSDAAIAVTGLINDVVVGTVNDLQAQVTVNGIAAQVANRSFFAQNIPLAAGPNVIQAIGRDRVGNAFTTQITVHRAVSTQARIVRISGDAQTAGGGTLLPQPLVAQLVDASGQPVANRAVIFKVTQSDGSLADASGAVRGAIAVMSDAQGRAQARWTLGVRAGAGNNRVEATATGFDGTALFAATATPGTPAGIHLDAGSGQTGAVGESLPFPFVVVVTDAGHNRLANVPVTFHVMTGGGGLNGGLESITTDTDNDGRALAVLELGPDAGYDNNIVEVTTPGSAIPIVFAASAKYPGAAADTTITGTVLDNSNTPLPGVTMRLYRAYQASNSNIPIPIGTPVVSDAQGQFVIAPAPVGAFKLVADGTTVQQPSLAYPTVEYDIVTIAGQDNTIGSPVYLPALDTVNRLCVSPTVGGTLTLPSVPGFAFTVEAGSAVFPGGSRTGCLTVTPVHGDKVPMVPGFGQQPRFVITIQPAGTHFTPPAQLQLPNVDGLLPRQVTEMYSYDHDLSSFIAIGTGTVSADGSVIRSDPGVGVMKAGWHCGGNPQPSGSASCCDPCLKCVNKVCVPDTAKNCQCDRNNICNNGAKTPVPGPACGTNSAIVPNITNLGNWAGCTPFGLTAPVTPPRRPTVNPCRGNCVARLRVGAYAADFHAGACSTNIDISGATDTDVKNTTYCAVMADLQPNASGRPPRTTYWSRAITDRHELFHITEIRTTLRARWPTFESAVEAMTDPFTCTIPSPAAALATHQTAIDTAFNTMMAAALNDWIVLGENPAYLDGKAQYQALVNGICARARTAGWTNTHPCGACPP
jgi:hypothetical protein